MDHMVMYERVRFPEPPLMLAGWPGMGNVGLGAVDYFRRKIRAKKFAKIDMSRFYTPEAILVKNGVANLPDLPSCVFYYTLTPPLVIFEGDQQVGGRDGIQVIHEILDLRHTKIWVDESETKLLKAVPLEK